MVATPPRQQLVVQTLVALAMAALVMAGIQTLATPKLVRV